MAIVLQNFLYPLLATLIFSSISSYFYYKRTSKSDIAGSTILYATLVFCIVYFVSFENNIGLGIGLLGLLSLIRLRSTPENLTDIGFVFYAITIGLLNASISDIWMIIFVNSILFAVINLISSKLLFKRKIQSTNVIFDDLDFDFNDFEKLSARIKTDLNIIPIDLKIKKIDHMKDSVTIKISYEIK